MQLANRPNLLLPTKRHPLIKRSVLLSLPLLLAACASTQTPPVQPAFSLATMATAADCPAPPPQAICNLPVMTFSSSGDTAATAAEVQVFRKAQSSACPWLYPAPPK